MNDSGPRFRAAAIAIDAWRLFYVLLPLFLVGSGAVALTAWCGVASEVERGRPYLVRAWKADPEVEKRLTVVGRETWATLTAVAGEVANEARGAAWDSAAAQKLRERFVDEAKKEPALEKFVDQLVKSYEAMVLFVERRESKTDLDAVRRAVGERIGAASTKIATVREKVGRFARLVALYRASQLAEYAGMARVAAELKGMIGPDVPEPAVSDAVTAKARAAPGRDPLKFLSLIDKVMSGQIGVKRELSAAWRAERVVVVILALLGFVLWVLRDLLPSWLFSGRREVGIALVTERAGEPASRRTRLVRGLVATLLLPVHGLMVAFGARGVADRVAGTRVVKR